MANYFTDYPDRIDTIKKYSGLETLAIPLEDTLGEKGTFKNANEAMDLYLGVLGEIGKFCANELRPAATELDTKGIHFIEGKVVIPEILTKHLAKCKELGVFSAGISKKWGGFNMPRAIQTMVLEMMGQACPNTSLTVAAFSMGEFLELYGTEEQKQFYLPKLLNAEWTTSMALTESSAGSDLGRLSTSARREGDHYIVNGVKQFITNGNSDITFALCRTDAASTGLNGLSVLIIPREISGKLNIRLAKVEDKVCLHSSPTCEILFENSVGYLLGPEGNGFKVMLELMNAARLAVASIALGIAVSAKEEAKKYAQTRVTMGKPIIQHPMIADMVYEMEIEISAMRAMAVEASMAGDWMRIYKVKGDEVQFKKWKKRYRRLTPLCKYMIAEKGVTIARNALQIFGGYGVCREYPAERLLRESLIHPIYEGTSQIQSLMVLKDTLKDVSLQAGGFLGSLAGAWAESKLTRDPVKSYLLQARNELNQGIRSILMSIIKEKFKSDIESLKHQKIQNFLREFSLELWSPKTDLSYPFLCAERFTRITSDYYALKSMADHYQAPDPERERWILEFAKLALPRMRLENQYMESRLPSTLDYIKSIKDESIQ